MIFDKTLQFSNAQAITATAVSTNVIDLGAMGIIKGDTAAIDREIARNIDIPLLVQVVETFNNLTSLAITVESASDEAFTSPKSIALGTMLLADLVAGAKPPFTQFPIGMEHRYVRLKYTVAGSNPTAGKITAGVVGAIDR
jgi:hypothetical protein